MHLRDRYDRTPLTEAIYGDFHEIIKLLTKCGSHLTGSTRAIGEQLCAAAARGQAKRLESYKLAGADLSQADPTGRTALHVAAMTGNSEMVKFLIKNYADKEVRDVLGLTPLDYARKLSKDDVVVILEGSSLVNGKKTNEE